MATTCPIGFGVAGLRAQVLATYDRVATTVQSNQVPPRGRIEKE
jgi:hypothetical protein